MKKGFFTFLLICLIALSRMPAASAAEVIASGTCGEKITWVLTDDGVLTLSGEGRSDSFNSNSSAPWYDIREQITTAVIEPGITEVPSFCFNQCYNLTSVTIPDTATEIGTLAFSGCSSLTEITISPYITDIWPGAFGGCNNLEAFDVDEDNPNYRSVDGFLYDKDVTVLLASNGHPEDWVRPQTVTAIGDSAFQYHTDVTELVIPEGITSIGANAFQYCSNLTSVTLPDSLTRLETGAFFACTSLRDINLPDSLSYIGDSAFHSCRSLTEITIPASITQLYYSTFGFCSKLASVTLPEGLVTIGMAAFSQCSMLRTITIPASVTTLGVDAFCNTYIYEFIFLGDAPTIDTNAFLKANATAYYPSGNETWTEEVMQNYGGTLTWKPYCTDGHSEVVIPGFAPTCNGTGLSDGLKCGICGMKLRNQEPTPALGHDYQWTVTNKPTLSANGGEHGLCTRCGQHAIRSIPKLPFPFVDVPENSYFYDSVFWAVDEGIAVGTSDTTFSPGTNCTRAQIVTFLWRSVGSPKPKSSACPFVDVGQGWYYDAVLWAVETGITAGTDPTHFNPNGTCTRAQAVTFLYRCSENPGFETAPAGTENPFADVPQSAYYRTPVLWAVANGITVGVSDTKFAPCEPCTRAQIVTFLYRYQNGRDADL